MSPITKPGALRRGDTIGVVAPAGPVNRERIDRALARVHERGFRTKTYGDIYRSCDYLAGDDQTRADELMAAFADPETTAVWCARGGYGVVRILDRLDFRVIGRHPKIFIGFSDITLLHIAIQQRVGLLTFHGPNLQDGFGKPDDMPAANERALWQAVMSRESEEMENGYAYILNDIDGAHLRSLAPGVARGQLLGGNLAVLTGVTGTAFEIETAGRILFLEDISERMYRIDRYLSQLRLAGKLDSLAGVLLGTFSYEEGEETDSASAVDALIQGFFAPYGIPVLAGFPAGHERFNLTLPIGAMVEIDADASRVTVLESPVLD
jgi:muramoyltetrapeptide carboxypeptidase